MLAMDARFVNRVVMGRKTIVEYLSQMPPSSLFPRHALQQRRATVGTAGDPDTPATAVTRYGKQNSPAKAKGSEPVVG